ncbi:MAG TPA: hypothetical protein VMY87_05255 [Armatimonadota bacterium]|nr:hypothetical protein [Armatimonadota bacterium]
MPVHRGERAFKVIGGVMIICAAMAFLGWGLSRGAAQQEEVGRYQVAVPDLILDTATGKLVSSTGQVLEQPIDPSGEEIGRYSVDGYVTAVTRRAGLDVINQPVVWPELIKGYVLLDTQTGQVIKQKIYYRQALQKNDL